MQAAGRGWIARRQLWMQGAAATTLQSVVRGRLSRGAYAIAAAGAADATGAAGAAGDAPAARAPEGLPRLEEEAVGGEAAADAVATREEERAGPRPEADRAEPPRPQSKGRLGELIAGAPRPQRPKTPLLPLEKILAQRAAREARPVGRIRPASPRPRCPELMCGMSVAARVWRRESPIPLCSCVPDPRRPRRLMRGGLRWSEMRCSSQEAHLCLISACNEGRYAEGWTCDLCGERGAGERWY